MFRHNWLLLLLVFDGTDGSEECVPRESPLYNGEMRPYPFVVHVWISRIDTGEHSCMGVRKSDHRIFVPDWCLTIGGEKRGRIAIYAPKQNGKVTAFTRACPSVRYDDQFELIWQDDDVRMMVVQPDGSKGQDKPNVVTLKTPKLSHHWVACFFREGDIFSEKFQNLSSMAVSWQRGRNGEFFFLQKLIDQTVKRKKSFEGLKEGIEDAAEAVLSVDHENNIAFDGFFKDPPKASDFIINNNY